MRPGLEAGELKDLKESHWSQVLERKQLKTAGKTASAVAAAKAGAPWKIKMARRLREAGAGYAWITSALHLGKASSVRVH